MELHYQYGKRTRSFSFIRGWFKSSMEKIIIFQPCEGIDRGLLGEVLLGNTEKNSKKNSTSTIENMERTNNEQQMKQRIAQQINCKCSSWYWGCACNFSAWRNKCRVKGPWNLQRFSSPGPFRPSADTS